MTFQLYSRNGEFKVDTSRLNSTWHFNFILDMSSLISSWQKYFFSSCVALILRRRNFICYFLFKLKIHITISKWLHFQYLFFSLVKMQMIEFYGSKSVLLGFELKMPLKFKSSMFVLTVSVLKYIQNTFLA